MGFRIQVEHQRQKTVASFLFQRRNVSVVAFQTRLFASGIHVRQPGQESLLGFGLLRRPCQPQGSVPMQNAILPSVPVPRPGSRTFHLAGLLAASSEPSAPVARSPG